DAEEVQHEPPEEKKSHKYDEDPDSRLQRRSVTVACGPGGRHGEENGNPAERIDDGKQRQEGGGGRSWQGAQEVAQRVSGGHRLAIPLKRFRCALEGGGQRG